MMTIANTRPMNMRPDAELTGCMNDQRPAGDGRERDGDREGHCFHAHRIDADEPQRLGILRDRRNRAAEESRLQEREQRCERSERHQAAGTSIRNGKSTGPSETTPSA